jgi:hypothetical protein
MDKRRATLILTACLALALTACSERIEGRYSSPSAFVMGKEMKMPAIGEYIFRKNGTVLIKGPGTESEYPYTKSGSIIRVKIDANTSLVFEVQGNRLVMNSIAGKMFLQKQ